MKVFCDYDEREWYSENEGWYAPPKAVPTVVFKTRVRDESIEGPNPL